LIDIKGFVLRLVGSSKEKFAPSKSFTSNVFTLMTGTAIAQAISFGVSPVLTRLYRPDEFGVFALFIGISSTVSVISAGRYEFAIVLPEKDEDAINILILSVVLVISVSVACLFILLLIRYFLVDSYVSGKFKDWLYYIPCYVVVAGAYQCFNLWNNRINNFGYISLSKIALGFCTALISVILGYYTIGVNGLIQGALLGQASATAILCWYTLREKKFNFKSIDVEGMKVVARRYSNFPKINVFHALIDNLNSSGIIFVIVYYFGAAIVGYYSFMMRIIQAPMGLVSSSVMQVFYQKASETYAGGGDLTGLIKRLMKRLAVLALFPALILLTAGPLLFRVVFGSKWEIAGIYAQIMTPYMYLYFMAVPLTIIPFILNKQMQSLLVSAIGNMMFFFSVIVGATIYNDIKASLIIYSVSYILYFIAYREWIISIIHSGRYRNYPAIK
jgi:O-antigen/teichoic acid export membrane protein